MKIEDKSHLFTHIFFCYNIINEKLKGSGDWCFRVNARFVKQEACSYLESL